MPFARESLRMKNKQGLIPQEMSAYAEIRVSAKEDLNNTKKKQLKMKKCKCKILDLMISVRCSGNCQMKMMKVDIAQVVLATIW